MVVHVPVGHLRRLSDACLLGERADLLLRETVEHLPRLPHIDDPDSVVGLGVQWKMAPGGMFPEVRPINSTILSYCSRVAPLKFISIATGTASPFFARYSLRHFTPRQSQPSSSPDAATKRHSRTLAHPTWTLPVSAAMLWSWSSSGSAEAPGDGWSGLGGSVGNLDRRDRSRDSSAASPAVPIAQLSVRA